MDKNIVYKPSGCFTFSVLIPCFNSESFIDQCLESVRSQTYQFWEVVVVDDGSTDNTAKHLRAVEEQLGSKMKVISQKNSGQLISRQAALASASGDYAIFLDADDMLRVDALEILRRFRANPMRLSSLNIVGFQVLTANSFLRIR